MTENLLKAHQLSVILNVPVSWIYSAARSGTLPAFRVGRYWRFCLTDVLQAIQRCEDTADE